MDKENKITFFVKEKIQETSNVVTLKLSCIDGIPEYHSGQFVTVFFKETGNPEGKSYTISSNKGEETLNITVKGIGEFSNKLCAMNIGDTVVASEPYGYFYSEENNTTLVMIAGGIGVAPFRSMITDYVKKYPSRKLFLFYSNKTDKDIIFKNEFENLQVSSSSFVVKNFITQQEVVKREAKNGRITISDIINETKHVSDKEFLICGSISFVRDFWKGLKESGIPEETIYTEAFF